MNISIDQIRYPIKDELKYFDDFFKEQIKTDNRILNIVLSYIVRHKGKNLRPIIVLLSSKALGEINHKSYVAATMIELLHTASLVHDDVVDNSQIRRSSFSIKALWKSKLAVLVGDYMLAQGLKISVKHQAFDILEIVSNAVQEISEGELLQIEKARQLNISEENYFEIIKKKTATLLVASALAGASAVNATVEQKEMIREFALNIGIAFQIKDDLFDYQNTSIIGKPQGNDIQESKMTLPLIYSLNNTDKKTKKSVLKILSKKVKSADQVKFVQDFVINNNGIAYSEMKLNEFRNKAKLLIDRRLANSEAKNSMLYLIDYIVERDK